MTKTDNRTIGGKFEQDLSHILAENGFWVHVMQQNKAGQPADLIAVKGRYHTLIDCKVISDENGFPFERVEENQKYAMYWWMRRLGLIGEEFETARLILTGKLDGKTTYRHAA